MIILIARFVVYSLCHEAGLFQGGLHYSASSDRPQEALATPPNAMNPRASAATAETCALGSLISSP